MLHNTYAVFRMKLLNLLHVPWTGEGESLLLLDVELWRENTDLKHKSLLSKKVTFCVCAYVRVCVGDFVYARISCFVRVCVCTCVRVSEAMMLNLRQKKIEINWSKKVYNQQNVNNTT